MLITRVELRNIKNHAESTFNFQPGVTAICGPNGSGKTTILEGIAWVLFDHLEYKREDFVRRGEKKGQVTISFISSLDEREYQVTRDTGGGYFVYDPVTKSRLVEQKSFVLPWLRQRLGVDAAVDLPTLFRTTIGVPQGTFTVDFAQPFSSRKAVFDQILKVEEYRQAADQLKAAQRLAESRVVEADRQVAMLEGELKGYDEVVAARDRVVVCLRNAEAAEAQLREEEIRLGAECRRLDDCLVQLRQHRERVEQAGMQLRSLHEAEAALQGAIEEAREAGRIVEMAREGYNDCLAAQRQLAELEPRRDQRDLLRGDLANLDRQIFEAESRLRQSEERLREVSEAKCEVAALAGDMARQESLEEEMARLREGRGELQGVKRRVEALEAELTSLRRRYQALSLQIDGAESGRKKAASLGLLELERRELDAALRREDLARERRRTQSAEQARVRQDLERLRQEADRLRDEIGVLCKLESEAERLSGLEESLSSVVEEISHLRAGLARDREMIVGLTSGAICPLLRERCLNLGGEGQAGGIIGETMESGFSALLAQREAGIETVERKRELLVAEVSASRKAALRVAPLSELRRGLAKVEAECAACERRLADLAVEAGSLSTQEEADGSRLQQRLSEVEEEIREAREAQRLLDRAAVMIDEQTQIRADGETRREEFDRLQGRILTLGDIEGEFSQAELLLRGLGDPRSRTLALHKTIEREIEWQSAERSAAEAVATLQERRTQLAIELGVFDGLDLAIMTAAQQRARCERDYEAFIANERLAGTLESKESEARQLAGECHSLAARQSAAIGELARLESDYDGDHHQRLRIAVDHCRVEAARVETELRHLRTESKRLEERLKSLNDLRQRLREVTSEREAHARQRERVEMIRTLLVSAAPYITESYIFSISQEAAQLYREISGRHDLTLRWNRDYEIVIEEAGHDRPFLSLSGGEQMVAALSVRLALLRELSEIDVAFFDEPTTNMDEVRRGNLAREIGRIRNFRQLFVISHDDTFEGFTDQTINLGELSV